MVSVLSAEVDHLETDHADHPIEFPPSSKSRDVEAEMMNIQHYLETLKKPLNVNGDTLNLLQAM